jgi:hypothetical protein
LSRRASGARLAERSAMKLGLLLSFLLLVPACVVNSSDEAEPAPAKPPSDTSADYEMRKLSVSYGAFADGSRLEIFAAVIATVLDENRRVASKFLHVRGGDELTVEVDGQRIPLRERIDGERIHLVAEIATPKDGNVAIALARGEDRVVAATKLAPAFEVTGFPSSFEVGDSVTFDITPHVDRAAWQGPEGSKLAHRIELFGECIRGGSMAIDLPEAYPLVWNSRSLLPLGRTIDCDVDVRVRLDTPVLLVSEDEKLTGLFEAAQYRTVKSRLVQQ